MPTDWTGFLRFFVDGMMKLGDISAEERDRIESQVTAGEGHQPMETLLVEASQMLSGLSRGAGLVITTKIRSPSAK